MQIVDEDWYMRHLLDSEVLCERARALDRMKRRNQATKCYDLAFYMDELEFGHKQRYEYVEKGGTLVKHEIRRPGIKIYKEYEMQVISGMSMRDVLKIVDESEIGEFYNKKYWATASKSTT